MTITPLIHPSLTDLRLARDSVITSELIKKRAVNPLIIQPIEPNILSDIIYVTNPHIIVDYKPNIPLESAVVAIDPSRIDQVKLPELNPGLIESHPTSELIDLGAAGPTPGKLTTLVKTAAMATTLIVLGFAAYKAYQNRGSLSNMKEKLFSLISR